MAQMIAYEGHERTQIIGRHGLIHTTYLTEVYFSCQTFQLLLILLGHLKDPSTAFILRQGLVGSTTRKSVFFHVTRPSQGLWTKCSPSLCQASLSYGMHADQDQTSLLTSHTACCSGSYCIPVNYRT